MVIATAIFFVSLRFSIRQDRFAGCFNIFLVFLSLLFPFFYCPFCFVLIFYSSLLMQCVLFLPFNFLFRFYTSSSSQKATVYPYEHTTLQMGVAYYTTLHMGVSYSTQSIGRRMSTVVEILSDSRIKEGRSQCY